MMIEFLFGSLTLLYLIVSSSVMQQYGDIEQKQYDDFGLVSAFHKYLIIPSLESYNSFKYCARDYYNRSPIDCLNLLDRYRSNWVFKVLIWQALGGPEGLLYTAIDPKTIIPNFYPKILKCISRKIRGTL